MSAAKPITPRSRSWSILAESARAIWPIARFLPAAANRKKGFDSAGIARLNRERLAMVKRSLNEDDSLDDFTAREITLSDATKRVYVAGSGPAVIVMTEMPGISPHVARFARWVRDAGFTVYMPSLFGRDGAVPRV